MARWLAIEDETAGQHAVELTLRSERLSHIHKVDYESHREFLARQGVPVFLEQFDGILLDIIDSGAQKSSLAASRFGAIHVCELLRTLAIKKPVVVYSESAHAPYFKIPLYEYDFVRACMTTTDLLDELAVVLSGGIPSNVVPRPTDDDYAALKVPSTAEVARAYHAVFERPDAWEFIWKKPSPTGKAYDGTRAFLRDNVRETLLKIPREENNRYAPVQAIVRLMAGLPCSGPTLPTQQRPLGGRPHGERPSAPRSV